MGPFLFFPLFSNFMLVRKCVQNIERMSYELVAYPQLPQPVDVMHLFWVLGLRARMNPLSLLSSSPAETSTLASTNDPGLPDRPDMSDLEFQKPSWGVRGFPFRLRSEPDC